MATFVRVCVCVCAWVGGWVVCNLVCKLLSVANEEGCYTIYPPVKPHPVYYFKWLLKVIKGQRAHFWFRLDPKGHIGSPKGIVPFSRGLVRDTAPIALCICWRGVTLRVEQGDRVIFKWRMA